MRDAYTRYPRTLLWLIPGGAIEVEDPALGARRAIEIEPFYLGKFPITNEQLEAFDPGFLRADHTPEDDDPAVGVSFEEASAYCRWYAGVSRKPMRLPTEPEWLHACRGGVEGRLFGDPAELDAHAWHAGNSEPRRIPRLAGRRANPFGLYGMLGGVWDWVDSPADGDPAGKTRILCGGSYLTPPEQLGCGLRRAAAPDERFPDAGFRVAKSLR